MCRFVSILSWIPCFLHHIIHLRLQLVPSSVRHTDHFNFRLGPNPTTQAIRRAQTACVPNQKSDSSQFWRHYGLYNAGNILTHHQHTNIFKDLKSCEENTMRKSEEAWSRMSEYKQMTISKNTPQTEKDTHITKYIQYVSRHTLYISLSFVIHRVCYF